MHSDLRVGSLCCTRSTKSVMPLGAPQAMVSSVPVQCGIPMQFTVPHAQGLPSHDISPVAGRCARGVTCSLVADGSLQNRKLMVHRSAVLSVTGCGCAVSLRLNPQNAHCQPAASRDTALLIIAPRRSEIALAGCPALATTAAAGHPPPPAPLLPRVELHSRRDLPPRLHALPPHPPPGGKRRLHWATHTAVHARWLTPRTCAPPAEPLPGGPPRPRAR